MAIQPLDLQVMFSQLDLVGKSQSVQKEGVLIQQTLQNRKIQERIEANIQAVHESHNTGDGAEGVNDRDSRKFDGRGGSRRRDKKQEEGGTPLQWDPRLGKNVDISG
ncbi:MAG: hypothetical protein LBP19_00170 [Treponema sp.]|jgi:hypothetical protein|nr:hypothetical protein [Treponema sp.]